MFNPRSFRSLIHAWFAGSPLRQLRLQRNAQVTRDGGARRICPIVGTILALILVCTASSSVTLFAQSPSRETIARGQSEFKQACGFCHAPDATGARGPDLVRSKTVAHDVNGDLIGEIIRNGRPDKGMPPLSLNPVQITAIAAFLHERAHEALESSHVPKEYPLAKLLTGHADAGKAYFDGAGGCKSCHSPAGDLKGIADKYPPIRLQTQMLYPKSDSAKPTVTVALPTGERFEGTLLHLDEFAVAMRDSQGLYRSFSLDEVAVEVHDPLAAHRKLLDVLTQEQFHDLFAYLETLK